MTFYWYNDFDK